MHKALWLTTLTSALLASTYLAAQEPNKAEADRQSAPAQAQPPSQTTAPMGTNPGTMGGQPQAPLANQASPADVGPAQANTANTGNSTAATNWPLGSTRQTAPTTVSAENDKLDKLPVIAYSFWLSDADKKLIVDGVANAPKTDVKNAKVSELTSARRGERRVSRRPRAEAADGRPSQVRQAGKPRPHHRAQLEDHRRRSFDVI